MSLRLQVPAGAAPRITVNGLPVTARLMEGALRRYEILAPAAPEFDVRITWAADVAVDETVTLLLVHHSHTAAVDFLDTIERSESNGSARNDSTLGARSFANTPTRTGRLRTASPSSLRRRWHAGVTASPCGRDRRPGTGRGNPRSAAARPGHDRRPTSRTRAAHAAACPRPRRFAGE